jgi:hypothetical protein
VPVRPASENCQCHYQPSLSGTQAASGSHGVKRIPRRARPARAQDGGGPPVPGFKFNLKLPLPVPLALAVGTTSSTRLVLL